MTTVNFGLPMVEAARRIGTQVNTQTPPKSAYVQSDGLRLHYFDWNPNPQESAKRLPILCLHGFAQNGHMWDFTALAIAHKYRVIALDQRGHGDSDWSPKQEYGLEPMQRDLENVTRALGLDRFIIMGLSMGGRNSYAFTARHPEKIAALIVVDVGPEGNRAGAQRIRQFTSQEDIMPTFDSFVERTMRYVPNREEWMVRGSLRNNLKQLPDGRWTWKYDPFLRGPNRPLPSPQSQQADPERNWREWRSITCPILIVRGEQTDILPADVARKMADLHPGHAKLVEVPRAGHLVPGDNPLGFEKVFLPFMDELEKKGITRR